MRGEEGFALELVNGEGHHTNKQQAEQNISNLSNPLIHYHISAFLDGIVRVNTNKVTKKLLKIVPSTPLDYHKT